jgi:prolyl 4-hydroxylase
MVQSLVSGPSRGEQEGLQLTGTSGGVADKKKADSTAESTPESNVSNPTSERGSIMLSQPPSVSVVPHLGLPAAPLGIAPLGYLFFPSVVQQTHNLIPIHLQANAMAASLNGTPGHQPALIPSVALTASILDAAVANGIPPAAAAAALLSPQPALTVQDRPLVPPVFNGVNPNYPGLRLLNANPPIFAVDNFLTPFECQFLVHAAHDAFGPAPVVGKGSGEISPSRTSSTCYLAREDLPDYLRKVSLLTGKPIEHCELPQVGRYLPSQQYLQHFDAFDLSSEDGQRFAVNGGQRTVTVLVYLNDVLQGGGTRFPALNLEVQPRQGMAIVFFPATVDGLLDKLALHAALPAIDTKYVSQVWIRQGEYGGQPSKRLSHTLGIPFQPTAGL